MRFPFARVEPKDTSPAPPAPAPRDTAYSPRLRTALVLTGTGTAGAYHAGALRALHEAGVKIDLVAGLGIGAVGAILAAVDGAGRQWEPNGPWRTGDNTALYRWRPSWRLGAVCLAVALVVLVLPLLLLGTGLIVYPLALVVDLTGAGWGAVLTTAFERAVAAAFAPTALPTIVPRLVVLALLGIVAVIGVAALMAWRRPVRRRARGSAWWRALGAPLSTREAIGRFSMGVARLVRGAGAQPLESATELSRGYGELLLENLGQPGFRELIVVVHDLDSRRDLVGALLAESQRGRFFGRRTTIEGERRQAELIDLAGIGRDLVLDLLAGALGIPVATESHLVTFAADSYWRGETHRISHRPEALGRLLDELAWAGIEQVLVVAAAEEQPGPHEMDAVRRDLRGQIGEYLTSVETAALRDAIAVRSRRFRGFFVVRPAHNPLGPLDFAGCYDERSDRMFRLEELADRGYEDAYRQFIDPVVGASGERLEAPGTGQALNGRQI